MLSVGRRIRMGRGKTPKLETTVQNAMRISVTVPVLKHTILDTITKTIMKIATFLDRL